MADDVTFTVAADATPPGGTVAATDETASGPHSVGSHMGVAKLAVSADGDSTHVPATAADGLLVEVSNAGAITFGGLTDAELRATPVPVDIDAPLGQAAMTASVPVVVASNQSAIPVTAAAQPGVDIGDVTVNNAAGAAAVNVQDGGNSLTVDGSVSLAAAIPAGTNNIGDVDVLSSALPTGAATLAEQQTQTASLSVLDDWDETDRAKVNPIVGQAGVAAGTGVDDATVQRVSLATNVPLPAGTNNIGDVDVLSLPSIPAGTNNIGDVDIASLPNEGQQSMANSISVAVASDQSNVPTKELRSGTSTVTTVADTASSTTLLASNANRLGAAIENDSSAVLYVKFGTTASATDYTVRMVQYAYYEVPFNYTGRIDGIWASDPGDGAARITELTA